MGNENGAENPQLLTKDELRRLTDEFPYEIPLKTGGVGYQRLPKNVLDAIARLFIREMEAAQESFWKVYIFELALMKINAKFYLEYPFEQHPPAKE